VILDFFGNENVVGRCDDWWSVKGRNFAKEYWMKSCNGGGNQA